MSSPYFLLYHHHRGVVSLTETVFGNMWISIKYTIMHQV